MKPEVTAVLARMRAILAEAWDGDRSLDLLARTLVPAFAEWCVLDTRGVNATPPLSLVEVGVAPNPSEGEGEPSTLAFPLLSRGKHVGLLTLGRRAPFDPSDVEAAEELASRCATAIDLAREAARVERTRGSRDDLINVLAHDLRTPLSTLSMVAARFKRNPVVLEAAKSETDVLTRSVSRIDALLRTVVDCTRLEAGKLYVQAERCELAAIVSAAVDATRSTAGNREVHFERPEMSTATFEVIGDAARLRQVVDQLLSNAMKFTPDGGTVLARIEAAASEVIVSVSDSGPGVAPENLSAIFAPPWDVPAGERPPGQGPRIGLYVARGIIGAQNGRLWVESALDQGSTFSFALPRAEAKADADRTPREPVTPHGPSR